MNTVLLIREKIIYIVREYENWFRIAGKLLVFYLFFKYMNGGLSYYKMLDTQALNTLLALVCSIAPTGLGVVIVAAVILVHLAHESVVIALAALVVMAILYLIFIHFASGEGEVLLLVLVPVLIHYNLGLVIPVIAGVLFTPYAAVPCFVSAFMIGFIRASMGIIETYGSSLSVKSMDFNTVLEAASALFTDASFARAALFYGIVCAVAIVVVYIVSRFEFKYSWYIAIAAGAVAQIVAASAIDGRLGVDASQYGVVKGAILGALIAAVAQFFKCIVDYSRKESLQFEDDEYYYYVKAIPKYLVSGREGITGGAEDLDLGEDEILDAEFETED
ncbi:MAG: hypothetical protein K5637_04665 [Lachnospiraceae bacterium]|nr:hypothetical protein [Lachnospiraceae bacterium]